MAMNRWILAAVIIIVFSANEKNCTAQLKDAQLADYEQWRLAQKGSVADPKAITTLPGFQIELVHVARPDEGSWISMAFDPKGRLVIGREDKGLMRLTLAGDHKTAATVETIENTLLECRGLLFAHDSLFVHANNSKGLYRLRDTNADDQYDEVKLLRKTEGGVGHGRNGLALGPDGMIYLAMGNNVKVADDVAATSPYRNYAIDRLLPCAWNEFLFDSDVVPPCGHIVRTDPEGKTWELFAGGFRNPYGIAFNRDGELFTYDADMEWDAGAPWYRPTSVLHVVSGGEYGWRQETNCWPEYFADSLPRVVDIGLGSPTGVRFGDRSHFPSKYQEAFYILDWAYGRIIAVHLKPDRSSYTGTAETFIKGRPLNVTDLDFGPDGAMYFVVGGRRTQSALYRVSFDRPADPPGSLPGVATSSGIGPRRFLEKFHREPIPDNFDPRRIWHFLEGDLWTRNAARLVLERTPLEIWQERALTARDPRVASTTLLALARCAEAPLRPHLYARLISLAGESLKDRERQAVWRAVQLTIIRLGPPDANQRRKLIASLQNFYRPESPLADRQMLCELLVSLAAPDLIEPTLTLLDNAPTQEEQLFYLFALRNVETGWTSDQRTRYFEWLKRAESFTGAHYLQRFVTFIRTDALSTLAEEHRQALAPVIGRLGKSADLPRAGTTNPARPEVRKWTIEELAGLLEAVNEKRDLARGRRLYVDALCARCHRKGGVGQPIGPDLDNVSSRFGRRDLLESILAPSKVVEEKYRNLTIETVDGRVVTGQLAGGSATALFIAPDPLEPAQFSRVLRASIVSRQSSPVSIMPEGLLNSLERDEILDLLAFIEAP